MHDKSSNLITAQLGGFPGVRLRNSVFHPFGWLMYAAAVTWFAMLSLEPAVAQETGSAAIPWRTGKGFDEFSKSPVSVSWQHAALRDHLAKFARSQKIAIVLDRRIDPNLQLDLAVKNVSIEQFMLRVAQVSGTKFCRFGDCYYIGPAANTERLLAINAILSGGRQSKKSLLSRKEVTQWQSLTTPNDVLLRWAKENDLEIESLQKIPHDLMAEVSVPAMRLDMRLALLLSQFDLWFKQSKKKQLITIEQPPENLSATLRMVGYEANKDLLTRVRSTAPQCKVAKTKRAITITGPANELEMARNVVIESFEPEVKGLDVKRFQLNVKNKRGLILNAVAEQLAMEVVVADDCKDALEDVVTVEVKDATVDELLRAILAGTDCVYSQDGTTLKLERR